jgi:hypothetical protein
MELITDTNLTKRSPELTFGLSAILAVFAYILS